MANEKRLIDANALCRDIEKRICEPCKADGKDYHEVVCRVCWVDDMRIEIEAAPTVDAVEVVRCKDCKQWRRNSGIAESPNGHCFCHDIETNGHDFCSYGERKDNEKQTD